jgi:hypothetical protein
MITRLRDIKAIVSQGFFQAFSEFPILKPYLVLSGFYVRYNGFKTKNELFSPFSEQE